MKKCYFCIVATAILFSTMEVAIKLSGAAFNSIQLTFLRFLIGGLMLLPFAMADLKKRQVKLTAGDMGYLLFLGTTCVAISMALMQVSLLGMNAGMVAIIISANPIFTMIFAHFVANDPFTRRKALALVLMLTGLVVLSDIGQLMSGDTDPFYLTCCLTASVVFGLYTAWGKRRIGKIGGIAQNAFSFLFGCGVLLVFMLIADIPVIRGISLETAPILLYLGIFVTGLGYYFYLQAIALGGPSMASISFFLKIIFAPILALIVLGEPITPKLAVAVVLILAGSYINISGGLKKKA